MPLGFGFADASILHVFVSLCLILSRGSWPIHRALFDKSNNYTSHSPCPMFPEVRGRPSGLLNCVLFSTYGAPNLDNNELAVKLSGYLIKKGQEAKRRNNEEVGWNWANFNHIRM